MSIGIEKPAQRPPDYVFRSEYQQRLKEYCLYRMEQLRIFLPSLEFWGVEHILDHYFRGLDLVCEEIDSTVNDCETKRANVSWLITSNNCWLFWEDTHAIIQGQEPYLPDNILEIPAFKEEIRKRDEAEKARIREIERQESEDRSREWAIKDKEKRDARLCTELGISPKALAKLREG